MATNTYVALKTSVVTGSAVSSVTIDNIPQGYTDLVLVSKPLKTTGGGGTVRIQFNGDSSSIYSGTVMYQENNTKWSDRGPNSAFARVGFWNGNSVGNTIVAHFQNYANTNVYKTFLIRTGNSSAIVGAGSQLWRSTAAINSMYIYNDGGNFDVGSTFTLYGVAAEGALAKATGGAIYSDSQYWYHAFGASGTFTPTQSLTADVLVVAGGGSGALTYGNQRAAGGGAGGVTYYASQSLTATGYTVTVGAGGAGQSTYLNPGTQGGNSQFASLTASVGGGAGSSGQTAGTTGGSGGGGGGGDAPARPGLAGTSGQGFAGGAGGAISTAAGGGGGAGGVGADYSSTTGGAGGVGISTYSSWSSATGIGHNVSGTYFIAGGGGGNGAGGNGTGGNGGGSNATTDTTAINGTLGTGSGSGGHYFSSGGSTKSGNGGSGIVIVRYAK